MADPSSGTVVAWSLHDERLVELLYQSMLDQVNIRRSRHTGGNGRGSGNAKNDDDVDDTAIQRCCIQEMGRAALNEIGRRRRPLGHSESFTSDSGRGVPPLLPPPPLLDQEIVQRAVERAWITTTTATKTASLDLREPTSISVSTTPTSFSWFARLDAAGTSPTGGAQMFPPPRILSWPEISNQGGGNLSTTLALLESVPYMDDLCLDWPNVLDFVQSAWTQIVPPTDQPDQDNDTVTRRETLVRLHRKWFDWTRDHSHNPEFATMQVDLIQSLMTLAVLPEAAPSESFSVRDTHHVPVVSCVETVLDMVTDWLHRNRHDPLPDEIGQRLWTWMGAHDGGLQALVRKRLFTITSGSTTAIRFNLTAWWWTLWLASYPTVSDLVELTSRDNVISKLVVQAHESLRHCGRVPTSDQSHNVDKDGTLWLDEYSKAAFCLSVLWSILVVTRCPRFPWWDESPSRLDTNGPTTTTSDNAVTSSKHPMHVLLQLYIDFVTLTIQREQQAPFLVDYDFGLCTFVDAIEVLVRGAACGGHLDYATVKRNLDSLHSRLMEWNRQSHSAPRATATIQCLLVSNL
jgi:hypothetical protein